MFPGPTLLSLKEVWAKRRALKKRSIHDGSGYTRRTGSKKSTLETTQEVWVKEAHDRKPLRRHLDDR